MAIQQRSRSIRSRTIEICAWVIGSFLVAAIVGAAVPLGAYAIGVVAVILAVMTLLRRLSLPHLGKARAFGLIWFSFALISTTAGYQEQVAEEQRLAVELAELRQVDPDQYLARIQERDEEAWLEELEALRPDQYADEIARREREAARQVQRERAAQVREAQRADARAAAEHADMAETLSQFENALSTASVAVDQPFIPPGTLDGVRQYLHQIDLLAEPFILAEGNRLTSDQGARLEMLRAEVGDFQVRTFPQVRDAYGPIVRRELWIDDTSARTVGAGFRTIQLTSVRYTFNRAIQEHLNQLRPDWIRLRFTTAMFIEYEAGPGVRADFDHAAPQDDEIVDWRNGFPRRLQPPSVARTDPTSAQTSVVSTGRLGRWRVDCGVPCDFSVELTDGGEIASLWSFDEGSSSTRPLGPPEYTEGVYLFRFTDEVGVSQREVAEVTEAGALTIRDRGGVTMRGEPLEPPNMSLLSLGGE